MSKKSDKSPRELSKLCEMACIFNIMLLPRVSTTAGKCPEAKAATITLKPKAATEDGRNRWKPGVSKVLRPARCIHTGRVTGVPPVASRCYLLHFCYRFQRFVNSFVGSGAGRAGLHIRDQLCYISGISQISEKFVKILYMFTEFLRNFR